MTETYIHNTDINPSDAYLTTKPLLAAALRDNDLLAEFGGYETSANTHQRNYRICGIITLTLAILSLELTVINKIDAEAIKDLHWLNFLAGLFAFSSIILAVITYLLKTKSKWLIARYHTEILRQWHFQSFLDGNYICLLSVGQKDFHKERTRRFRQLLESLKTAPGAADTFVRSEEYAFMYKPTPYSRGDIFDEVAATYLELRIDKQISYFAKKMNDLREQDDQSGAFAKWSLVSAVGITALHFLTASLETIFGNSAMSAGADFFFFPILALAIFSMGIRVFRSGQSYSDEMERYELKWERLVALREVFNRSNSNEKLEVMKECEILCIDELKGFLRSAKRASYLL